MPPLKPQDVAVALQLALTPGLTYAALAAATGISQGEVHNAVRRLRGARLVRADVTQVHGPALLEFLGAGVPYAFPADAGAESRGVPTAHAAGVLGEGFSTTESLVWPSVEGRVRGASVVPLYDGAAATATRNPALYELLALVDAVRLGRVRERTRATQVLRGRIRRGISAPSRATA
ncbi:MAG: hypothetical protein U5K74_02750 [Gemmatimonadaceae bacterium]|nr:hypothetical protein [Gemmatimonadaceae bacterium]